MNCASIFPKISKNLWLLKLFISLLLVQLSKNLISLTIPFLLKTLSKDDTSTALQFKSIFDGVQACTLFIILPIYGHLGDLMGQKYLLIGLVGGMAGEALCLAFVGAGMGGWVAFGVGRAVGILGSPYLVVLLGLVAKLGEKGDRASHFGIVGAAYGGGLLIGPQLGKVLALIDWWWPYVFCIILLIINAIYVYFFFPEVKELRRIRQNLTLYYAATSIFKTAKQSTWAFFGISFLYAFADQSIPSTLSLYTNYRFNWNQNDGLPTVSTVLGALLIFWQLIGIPLMNKVVKLKWFLCFALVMCVFGQLLMGVSQTPWVFYLSVVLSSFDIVAHVVLETLISTNTNQIDQGMVIGMVEGIYELAGFGGMIASDNIFAGFLEWKAIPIAFKGGQFFLSSFFFLISAIITATFLCVNKDKPESHYDDTMSKALPWTKLFSDDEDQREFNPYFIN